MKHRCMWCINPLTTGQIQKWGKYCCQTHRLAHQRKLYGDKQSVNDTTLHRFPSERFAHGVSPRRAH